MCHYIRDRVRVCECLGCGGPRWGGSRGWGRMSRATPPRAASADTRTCPERSIVHIRVHSALVGTAESCGTAPSVAGAALLPCAQTPLTAHGSPTTIRDDRKKRPSFQQKPVPASQSLWSPMCNTEDNRTHRAHPPRFAPRSVCFRLEIGPIQPGQPDVEARTTSSRAKAACRTSEPLANSMPAEPDRSRRGSTTDFEPELDRSRHGVQPISARSTTDLEPESDRSRRGSGPISTKGEARGVHRSADTAVARPVVAGFVPRS